MCVRVLVRIPMLSGASSVKLTHLYTLLFRVLLQSEPRSDQISDIQACISMTSFKKCKCARQHTGGLVIRENSHSWWSAWRWLRTAERRLPRYDFPQRTHTFVTEEGRRRQVKVGGNTIGEGLIGTDEWCWQGCCWSRVCLCSTAEFRHGDFLLLACV